MYFVPWVWGLQYITATMGQKLGVGVGGTEPLFNLPLFFTSPVIGVQKTRSL